VTNLPTDNIEMTKEKLRKVRLRIGPVNRILMQPRNK
jgi:hypothetical protein